MQLNFLRQLGLWMTMKSLLHLDDIFILCLWSQTLGRCFWKEDADAAKRSFAGDSCSDHIALLKAFEGWKESKRNRIERSFCWENLSPVTLQMMDDMRKQFVDLLSDIGFVDKSKGPNAYNQYSDNLEMVFAILCAGLYPNVVQCRRRGKRTAFYSKEDGKVVIHPASVNAGVHLFPLPYLGYSDKVKPSSITSVIQLIYLIMLSSCLLVIFFQVNLDRALRCSEVTFIFLASKNVLELLKKLRGELYKLLNWKIEEPGLDITAEGKAVVAAAIELLHSQTLR